MRRRILPLLFFLLNSWFLLGQAPNDANFTSLSGGAIGAIKQGNTPINYYTGAPNISIPIYQYSHQNGLKLSVSLDYVGSGGIRVNEAPSPAGVGWFLNTGGVIARTVRGRPDDIDANGYMYAPVLPSDYRPNARKYYYDTLDAEQDVFHYNINGRAGKFFIGKNKEIVTVPLTKLRIGYVAAANSPITTFYIITEDGVKYVFSEIEYENINTDFLTNDFKCGYNLVNYSTAWHLSEVVAPFGTDTIRFSYNTVHQNENFSYPQSAYINNSNGNLDFKYTTTGNRDRYIKKIASITFPDKKNLRVLYSPQYKYDGRDSVIDRIKISDSIFRQGCLFKWFHGDLYTLLDGIQFYTAKAAQPAYQFTYTLPYLRAVGTAGDTLSNKRDHWGFYNGANNGNNVLPTVQGIYTGANRNPSALNSSASILRQITDPSGGITNYLYEPNEACDYSYTAQGLSLPNVLINTQTAVSLNQVSNNQHSLQIYLPTSVTQLSSSPFSGTCNLSIMITSTDGLTNIANYSTTLQQLYSSSWVNFNFTAPSGNYLLKTSLSGGCSSSVNPLPLIISWINQAFSSNSVTTGGVRIKQQLHWDPITKRMDTIATYKYLTTDGKSSGFLGPVPKYDYPYQRTVINGTTTTTNYTAISSDPVNNLTYTQGNTVGYSRVVVYKGTPAHNLGSEVYEYTNLLDANSNALPATFPYAPASQRDWAMGLPKRISIYDSLGTLVSIKRNTYDISTVAYNNSNFQSLKLGRTSITYNGDPAISTTPRTEYYAGQLYFPETGRANLLSTIDSIYHPNGSIQVSEQTLQYDTNHNVIKVTSPYNKSRGLTLEKRLYYPYHYTLASGGIKKLKDSGIISAVISTESWITGDANPRLLQANIMDYQQLPSGHVKPLTSYVLQSNAPVAQSMIGVFNPASLVRNTTWLVPQQNFLTYDNKGNLLETKNAVSGERSAIIMDYNNQLPIAQASNSPYSDVAYTSFESDGSGNWSIVGNTRDYSSSITGKASYPLSGGNITKAGLTATRSYLILLWAKNGATVNVNGSPLTSPVATQNGWNFYQTSVTGTTSVTISGTGLLDELRLHPKEANMSTSCYEPMVGVTSVADANNTINYYTYDNLNRLSTIKDKDLNILKKYEYDNTTQVISTVPDWQTTGTQCRQPLNGIMDRIEKDMNPFSDTYNATRIVFDRNDCAACQPSCTTGQKLINCQCEYGILFVASAIYTKETGVWKWKCTYYYKYSDCSVVYSHVLYKDTSCSVQPSCD